MNRSVSHGKDGTWKFWLPAALGIAVTTLGGRPAALPVASRALEKARIAEAYGKLPLRFEANQDDAEDTQFLSRGSRYTLLLAPTKAVLVLSEADVSAATVRITFAGGNPRARLTGVGELPGKTNYLIGSDASKWRTDVTAYARVEAHDVYPGIDVAYYGNGLEMEEDFLVAAGGDPKNIALDVSGAEDVSIDPHGELVLANRQGDVHLRRPMLYQLTAGRRREISGGYEIRAKNRVGFEVGPYDVSQPLVIDPVLSYSTYLGGSAQDNARGIAVDSSGNVYVAGGTVSTNFPVTGSAFQSIYGGNGTLISGDAFVAKLNPDGTALVYCTYVGGSDGDFATGIAVDASGNAYVTGATSSTNFPGISGSSMQSTFGGGVQDAFVFKLNASGTALTYSTYLGGSAGDYGVSIAVDSSGNAFVTGFTANSFPPAPASIFPGTSTSLIQPARSGFNDAFVSKLNAAGTALVYSTYLGGTSQETPGAIAVDSSGSAYVTGGTYSTNFPATTSSLIQSTSGGLEDGFVVKVNATGTALVYSTYLGGSGYDEGRGIAVDSAGNAYVAGSAGSTGFPGTASSALQSSLNGAFDAFVVKVNAAGTALVYSSYLGGSSNESAFDLALDSSGNAYVTGTTGSSDFPGASSSTIQSTLNGTTDVFIAKVNPAGTALLYSTYLGGSDVDLGNRIAVDAAGNAYVAGITFSTDFLGASSSSIQSTDGGLGDALIAKIGAGSIADLMALVNSLSLSGGTASSMLAKLQNSKVPGPLIANCNQLVAFINEVNAQTGKSLTAAQANALIAAATAAGATLGCH